MLPAGRHFESPRPSCCAPRRPSRVLPRASEPDFRAASATSADSLTSA